MLLCFKIVCDEDRDNYKGKKNKEKVCEAIYFYSFGIDMPIEVENYLKNFRPIAYSNRHIQNIHTVATFVDGTVSSLIMH